MTNFNDQVPQYVRKILSRINAENFDAYLVGGCVRDIFLGRDPSDFDIASNASVKDIIRIFPDFGIINYAASFGSLTILKEDHSVEITSFRIESRYSDLRRPDNVSFTNSIYDDLQRRDFTINSMAWSKDELIDPFGGRNDIEKRVIRTTGSPFKRFSEDPLRILRALRFACVLDFEIDKYSKQAMHDLFHLLVSISKERILNELIKIFSTEDPVDILSEFIDILTLIIPLNGLKKGIRMLDRASGDPFVGFALLLTDYLEKEILHFMKMSNNDIKLVIKYFHLIKAISNKHLVSALKACSALGRTYIPQIESLVKSISDDDLFKENIFAAIRSDLAFLTVKDLQINGNDLIRENIAFGRDIGILLNKLFDLVLAGKLENKYTQLLMKAGMIF